ncbi:NAD(P)/FAD-dependent oxidoreductase [Schleiferiaceae bacterium]|jgi:predicted Rossmann fold flavoprotein|nr:aminoacetone oxidase family FAD-binding enzyme [Flavobacteriales bacterium]MDC1021902.1 NAD(P)/FAD-dependent oxidoreductase [Schleiferiaceae bacterium]|tara:strand:+ start:951 stop:2174 length:1224 start_codon:yes stop_codon:yes gene_type:complete
MSTIVVIGGGAAGFFAAIASAEANPDHRVILLEKGKEVLGKVLISGGGRCNVTHACFDPKELATHYPRGSKELLGPLHKFQPGDTMEWFADRGVELKIEGDNRVFPITDSSSTIANCLIEMAEGAHVEIKKTSGVKTFSQTEDGGWKVFMTSGDALRADKLMIATGSSKGVWEQLKKVGHKIIPPVPSLFTFNIKDPRINGLSGISLPNATIQVASSDLESSGPLLITHWGMSGPAVLRLSAWGAYELNDRFYRFPILVNWIGRDEDVVVSDFMQEKKFSGKKRIGNHPQYEVPLRLWKSMVAAAGISNTSTWGDLNLKQIKALASELCSAVFQVSGKSTFKDEFVTAGGVDLKEVNFKTFSSKVTPNLYFAGEVLNIDGITGGFNFQAAWTGGFLAGNAMAGYPLD